MKSSQNSTIKWKATLRILSDSFINITGIFAASIKYWIRTIIKTNLTLISTFLQSIGSPPQRACCPARTLWRVGLSAFRLCLMTINTFGGDFFNRYLWHLTLSCYKIILSSWSIYFTVLKETKTEKEGKKERERRANKRNEWSARPSRLLFRQLGCVRVFKHASSFKHRGSFVISIYILLEIWACRKLSSSSFGASFLRTGLNSLKNALISRESTVEYLEVGNTDLLRVSNDI